MPTEKHWDNLAKSFEVEVGNPLFDDRNGTISSHILACSDKHESVIDFGCGIGAALPLLSANFSDVTALDISAECIKRAQSIAGENVLFLQKDLTKPIYRLRPAQLGYCCNVAILPDMKMNKTIFTNVLRAVQHNGHALFIVPSLESAILSAMRLADWYEKEKIVYAEIDRKEFHDFHAPNTIPHMGILSRSGVLTKHYLREEIELFFQFKSADIASISKVEYDWTTEFADPPAWMKAPFPWDWMVHYRKK